MELGAVDFHDEEIVGWMLMEGWMMMCGVVIRYLGEKLVTLAHLISQPETQPDQPKWP